MSRKVQNYKADRNESLNESAVLYNNKAPARLEIISGHNNLNNSFAGPVVG